MARTVFAMITLLDDGSIDPGFGNRPGGGGNRPNQDLPGGRPPHVGGGPIYHPGHPDHGLPSEQPHPDQELPWSPGSPDQGLPVPPGITAPPTVPPNLKDKLVVLWRLPNTTQWHGKAMDPSLSAGAPLPEAPEPKA